MDDGHIHHLRLGSVVLLLLLLLLWWERMVSAMVYHQKFNFQGLKGRAIRNALGCR